MKSRNISFQESLNYLQSVRSQCRPNNGFVRQLKLFQFMKYSLDIKSPKYLQFLITHDAMDNIPDDLENDSKVRYKCSKCRTVVAGDSQVLPHGPGVSPDWCPGDTCDDRRDTCRQGIFIVSTCQVRSHVSPLMSLTTAKYNCVRCGHKLGNIGLSSCGCGATLTRGIWVNLRQVDRSVVVM